MQLTHDQVRKIAKLARLSLTSAQVDMFARQLSDVFEYAAMLNEVDTEGVEPIAQITGLKDVFFEDAHEDCQVIAQLLEQSPQKAEGNMIRVKKIL